MWQSSTPIRFNHNAGAEVRGGFGLETGAGQSWSPLGVALISGGCGRPLGGLSATTASCHWLTRARAPAVKKDLLLLRDVAECRGQASGRWGAVHQSLLEIVLSRNSPRCLYRTRPTYNPRENALRNTDVPEWFQWLAPAFRKERLEQL